VREGGAQVQTARAEDVARLMRGGAAGAKRGELTTLVAMDSSPPSRIAPHRAERTVDRTPIG